MSARRAGRHSVSASAKSREMSCVARLHHETAPAARVRTGPQEEFKGTQDQYAPAT